MITAALALLSDIEAAIVGQACQPDVSRVTAGEPAAPNPGCTDIAVWVGQVEDSAAFDPGCQVRSELTLNYRIGWCYTERPEGPSEADELEAATCVYDLAEAVWCYLVELQSQGIIAGLDSCRDSRLGPLTVNPRSGGWVSATGSVTIAYDCHLSS